MSMFLVAINVSLLLVLGYMVFRIKRSERWQYTVEHNRNRMKLKELETEIAVLRDVACEAAAFRDDVEECADGKRLDGAINRWLDLRESLQDKWADLMAAE
jgi:hypothetical protein